MTHPTTRWPRCIAALSLVSLVCLAGPAGAAPLLGLLPVSVEGAVGAPDRTDAVSRRLAAVLEGPGGFRVVSLEEPVQPAGATARAVRGWALDTGAEAVVVGHLEGGQLWLQLRSGHSGGLLGGWSVPEGTQDAAWGPTLRAMRKALGAPPLPGLSRPGEATSEAAADAPLVGNLRSEGPISIQSDQLDVVSRGGKRHLLFTDNVRVEQGDIELLTRRLDAYYEEGESQPERLEAKGDVQVVQGDRVAQCESATYLRAEQRVVCSGRARLVQGCDVVRGKRIEFDLEREHFTVLGAASVVLGEKDQSCPDEVSS